MRVDEMRKSKLIRINQKNSLCEFNEDSLMTFKSTLYSQLLELDEVDTNYILTYLYKVYFTDKADQYSKGNNLNYKFDFVKITSKLSKRITKLTEKSKPTNGSKFKDNILDSCFGSKDNYLLLDEKCVISIGNIVAGSFNKIEKEFNIKSQKDFFDAKHKAEKADNKSKKNNENKINHEEEKHKEYCNYSKDSSSYINNENSCEKTSSTSVYEIERKSTNASLISKINESTGSITNNMNRISYYSKLNISIGDINKADPYISTETECNISYKSSTCTLYNKNNKIKENTYLPEDIVTLIQTFQIVKKIKIVLPKIKSKDKVTQNEKLTVINYLIILINLKWLFPNILGISIDLESDLFKTKFGFKNENENENLNNNNNVNNDHSESLYNKVSENKIIYELMMFIPFFVSIYINYLNTRESINTFTFSLNLPECYQIELDFLLKIEKILVNNFHILDLIDFDSNITELHLTFNSLDSNTFQRIISMIHKSNNLRMLKLNLFPNTNSSDSDEYYNSYLLSKIANLNEINVTTVKGNYYYCSNYNTNISCLIDENENLLNALSTPFEKNLEFLIYILSRKVHNLSTMKINFDIPSIVFITDKYSNLFHKFINNIFSLVDHTAGNCGNDATLAPSSIENIKITSINFTFNSRKHPYIENQIRKINMRKNEIIKNFTLDMRFNKISEIGNIIPGNVQFLSLSQFDHITLASFINFFKKETNCLPHIFTLEISLSDILFNFNCSEKLIYDFFTVTSSMCSHNLNLKEIKFNTNKLPLNDEHFKKIITIIKKDKKNYHLILSKNNISTYLFKKLKREKIYNYLECDTYRLYPLIFSLNKIKDFDKIEKKEKMKKIYCLIDNFLKKRKQKVVKIELK